MYLFVHKILYCTDTRFENATTRAYRTYLLTTFRLRNRLNLFLLINFDHKFNYLGATSLDTPVCMCTHILCLHIGLCIPVRNGHI